MDAAAGRADVEETCRRLLAASQENHLPTLSGSGGAEAGASRMGRVGGTDIGIGAALNGRHPRAGMRKRPADGRP